MPGSGVLEARALLGFLPSLCRRLLGEDLKMPHIATWWCGQKAAREEVLSRLDEFAIEGAYGRGVPGFREQRAGARRRTVAGRARAARGPRSTTAASILSARSWCGSRRRRCGSRAASRRVRSCCGCLPPRRPTAGPSCPAASAGSPSSPMPARCRWATARGRPTSGWSPTRRFRPRRCCRRSTRCGSGASPAWCRAAPPTICSGSAAISSAPRRRCGWCARSARRARSRQGHRRPRCTRSSASSGCW